MSSTSKTNLTYADIFAIVGKFIAKKGLSDVCVMEFEDGMVVVGSVSYETSEEWNRRTETHVLSYDDLKRLAKGG